MLVSGILPCDVKRHRAIQLLKLRRPVGRSYLRSAQVINIKYFPVPEKARIVYNISGLIQHQDMNNIFNYFHLHRYRKGSLYR